MKPWPNLADESHKCVQVCMCVCDWQRAKLIWVWIVLFLDRYYSSSSCIFKLHKDDCYVIQRIFLSQWLKFLISFFFSLQVAKEISQVSGIWILVCPRKIDVNSEFNSKHDTQQNWLYEGFPVMSAIKRIENICGRDGGRDHRVQDRDREKKRMWMTEREKKTGGQREVRVSLVLSDAHIQSLLPPPPAPPPPTSYHICTLKK